MTAEERALEAYPICKVKSFGPLPGGGISEIDMNQAARNTYLEGYHQAEKDNALTWEDIRLIDRLGVQFAIEHNGYAYMKKHYEEVLRRFNKERNKV